MGLDFRLGTTAMNMPMNLGYISADAIAYLYITWLRFGMHFAPESTLTGIFSVLH